MTSPAPPRAAGEVGGRTVAMPYTLEQLEAHAEFCRTQVRWPWNGRAKRVYERKLKTWVARIEAYKAARAATPTQPNEARHDR